MVRNIDLVEAIIFYGQESLFQTQGDDDDDDDDALLPGVANLMQECERDDTAVLAILNKKKDDNGKTVLLPSLSSSVKVHWSTQPPPNPRDLWDAIHSIVVQPKGFGGSSGFGSKTADPERPPSPQHCVVLCATEAHCRAARYSGMRVLCLTDNDLADAIIDDNWESICMDDIATPGSFWLNPPHPRDDESNGVDPEAVIRAYEEEQEQDDPEDRRSPKKNTLYSSNDNVVDNDMSDDQLKAILADMDSL